MKTFQNSSAAAY